MQMKRYHKNQLKSNCFRFDENQLQIIFEILFKIMIFFVF